MLSSPFHPTHPLKPILTIFLALKLWEHHTSYGPTPLTAPFFQNVFIRSLVVLTKLKKYVSSPKTLYQLQEGKNHIIYCCWTTIFIIQIIIVSSSSYTFRCFKGTSNATCQKKSLLQILAQALLPWGNPLDALTLADILLLFCHMIVLALIILCKYLCDYLLTIFPDRLNSV